MEELLLGFVLKKVASTAIMPPVVFLLCIVAGLLLMRRRPKTGRILAWGGVILAWLACTPASVGLLVRPLENIPLLQAEDLARGEAIVILGAGAHRYAPEYDGPAPKRLALERLRFGARLARASGLPVLLSGETGAMAEALWVDFGVPPRWLEGDSLDTADNARNSATILRAHGISRVVLVTHALHMRRSVAEFALHGIETIPAPTGFFSQTEGENETALFDYLPGPTAAFAAWYATHEWVGLLMLELRKRLR